mmetsp:Transcript_1511/g.2172  ORF Transcript_1511/g.2172 Transcript_1511/m.2172 type:complete len:84 (-) Transcript_1511:33-284(-)
MVQLLAIKMYLEVYMGGKEGTLLAIKMEVQMARLVAIKTYLEVQMSGNERNFPTDWEFKPFIIGPVTSLDFYVHHIVRPDKIS